RRVLFRSQGFVAVSLAGEVGAMPIRRGEEYLESLRDGRRLWLMGQPVDDVTTHPALAGCARSVADVYDLQHDREHHDLLTFPSPATGKPVSRAYQLPHSVDDLASQRRAYEYLVRPAAPRAPPSPAPPGGGRWGEPAARVQFSGAPRGRRRGPPAPASGDGGAG